MNVKLYYLFSNNKKIGSKLISWGTSFLVPKMSSVPSHIALLINDKYVFESTMAQGVRVVFYKDWLSINNEVAKIQCKKDRTFEEIKSILKPLKNKSYDYLGVVYFGWRVFLNMLFKLKMPKINKLQSDKKYFCSEAVSTITGIDSQMLSPVELMLELKKFE